MDPQPPPPPLEADADSSFQLPTKRGMVQVWAYIFKTYVTSPFDWASLLVASPDYFSLYLGDKKDAFRLLQVLPILFRGGHLTMPEVRNVRVSKLCRRSIDHCFGKKKSGPPARKTSCLDIPEDIPRNRRFRHGPHHHQVIIQHVIQGNYLPHSDILKMRLISKTWKNEIDHRVLDGDVIKGVAEFFQEGQGPPNYAFNCWRHSSSSQTILYPLKISRWAPSTPESLPWLFSTLNLTAPRDLTLAKVSHILSVFGRSVQHLRFQQFCPSPDFYKETHKLLVKTPNLRSLELQYSPQRSQMGDTTELKQKMESLPLPELASLSLLKVEVAGASPLVNALVQKYGGQVDRLWVSFPPPRDPQKVDKLYEERVEVTRHFHSGALSSNFHLNHLYLKNGEIGDAMDWPPNMTALHVTQEYSWEEDTALEKIFTSLTTCIGLRMSSSLKDLRLRLVKKVEEPWMRRKYVAGYLQEVYEEPYSLCAPNAWLSLPFVKRLEVSTKLVEFRSIDFILGLRDSLEEFYLIMDLTGEGPRTGLKSCACQIAGAESHQEIIKFWNCWDSMYESNVWEVMPNLRKMTIKCTVMDKKGDYVWRQYDY